jgi:hypothetical protein
LLPNYLDVDDANQKTLLLKNIYALFKQQNNSIVHGHESSKPSVVCLRRTLLS